MNGKFESFKELQENILQIKIFKNIGNYTNLKINEPIEYIDLEDGFVIDNSSSLDKLRECFTNNEK